MQVTAQDFNSPVVECQEEMGLPAAIPGDGTMLENPAGSPRLPGTARNKMFLISHVSLDLADDWHDPIRLFHMNQRLFMRKIRREHLTLSSVQGLRILNFPTPWFLFLSVIPRIFFT